MSTVTKQLEAIIENEFRCYHCNEPTDRYITFRTSAGIINAFECIGCRQKRVKMQVEAGLRPASDLEPENLPENRPPISWEETILREDDRRRHLADLTVDDNF